MLADLIAQEGGATPAPAPAPASTGSNVLDSLWDNYEAQVCIFAKKNNGFGKL